MKHITRNIKGETKPKCRFLFHVPCSMFHVEGFTVVELLLSITIFSLIVFTTVAMLTNILTGSQQGFLALDNVDNARSVSARFANEIRNASIGVDGSYQIGLASDNQIIFYSQAASSGATVNRINYYLTGTTLYKGVTIPTGSPQTYNLATEVKNIILRDVVNQASPIFTYYDGNYNGSGVALIQPINVTSIKFVKINLTVLNQIQKNQSAATFNISVGANIRNLKDNLGN